MTPLLRKTLLDTAAAIDKCREEIARQHIRDGKFSNAGSADFATYLNYRDMRHWSNRLRINAQEDD